MAYPFTLPELPYAYNALEPYIDGETMELHHTKHHQAYIDKLNKALEPHADLQKKSIEELLGSLVLTPEDIRLTVRNNGGGHANHSIFWTIMRPSGGGEPTGSVADAIAKEFGDFDAFRKKFSEDAAAIFGSGWVWLGTDDAGVVHIHASPNQDSPLMHGHVPILGIDVWEHAYYLKYRNKRAEYVENWWNLVNWDEVNRRYEQRSSHA